MMLIELTVKSSLVLAVALASVAVMRRRSAAARHVVLASAFVATLALPAIVIVGPHWELPSLAGFTKPSELSRSHSVDVRRGLTHRGSSVVQGGLNAGKTSGVLSRWRPAEWLRVLTIVWL